jgi:hypothetical protein
LIQGALSIMVENKYEEVLIDGVTCVEFITGGKHQHKALVDKKTWDEYLHKLHWTAIKRNGNYFTIIASQDKLSVRLHRIIVEHEYLELDYWGKTIDHENNNTLDNRLANLRIYNSKLNATNIKSKFLSENNHLIHKLKNGGYKVHTNVFDEVVYKYFKELDDARIYRDQTVLPYVEKRVAEMIKKTRDIEFERGLRDKLENDERQNVLEVLKKYGIVE